jgi:formylmethanofuran dehydrogenase subunit E
MKLTLRNQEKGLVGELEGTAEECGFIISSIFNGGNGHGVINITKLHEKSKKTSNKVVKLTHSTTREKKKLPREKTPALCSECGKHTAKHDGLCGWCMNKTTRGGEKRNEPKTKAELSQKLLVLYAYCSGCDKAVRKKDFVEVNGDQLCPECAVKVG